jgi:hypothetical protein
MDVANNVVSQINQNKENSVIKLQNAFRNKRAINEFASKYANRVIEEKQKEKQKDLYLKYSELYQPSTNLQFIPFIKNPNNIEIKQKRLKAKLNKEIEDQRLKAYVAEHLKKYPLH